MSPNGHSHRRSVSTPVRVAVVGSGPFAELHANAFADNPDCELIAIVGRTIERARELADRSGAPYAYRTIEELVSNRHIDAVTVATAGRFHHEPTVAAIKAGASVLLEKPVVLSSADGRVLRAAAEDAPGFVMPAHILRFAAPYQELRHRLKTGAVGAVRAISLRRHRTLDHDSLFPDLHPVLMTMIHDIDLALWMTGSSPLRVTARQIESPARSQPLAIWAEVETTDHIALSFQVSWSLAGGSLPDALEIVGDNGALALALSSRVHDFSAGGALVDDALTPDASHGALREEVRAFVDGVRFGEVPKVATLEEALAGIDLAEQIIAVAEQNRIGGRA